MRTTLLFTTFTTFLLSLDTLEAQRGGGRLDRWRRPEQITNRVAVWFHDIAGPKTDGDKVADLGTVELVRNAQATNLPALLYLHDSKANEDTRLSFERQLFPYDRRGDELGLRLRLVHCGRVDVAGDEALKKRYGDDLPLFVAFGPDGSELKALSMAGYEADGKKLAALLDKASKGAFKPSLKALVRKQLDLLAELEELLKEKASLEDQKARAAGDRSKIKKAERELEQLAKTEQKLLEQEQKLLQDVQLPAHGAARLGGFQGLFGRGGGRPGAAGRGGGERPGATGGGS